MSHTETLEKFGLPASPRFRQEIRALLSEETEREKRGGSGEEMLRLLCVQLMSLGFVEDCLLIWEAKQSSHDASCAVDVQFLCGGGLLQTQEYLAQSTLKIAADALAYLIRCDKSGDFSDWTPPTSVADYRRYYGVK